MTKTKTIAYVLLWAAYMLFSFYYFPVYDSDVAIPSMILTAIGARLYGTYRGLLIVAISMPFHYVLLDYYGDILTVYQSKALGVCMQTATAFLFGSLKYMQDVATRLSSDLDKEVIDRTRELNQLIELLIIDDEKAQRNLGQDIHDGLSQHLTALLLFSSSLQKVLHDRNSPAVQHIDSLAEGAQRNLQLARKTSHTLFPFKMKETGFEAAFNGLISYFKETTSLTFTVHLDGCERFLPEIEAVHLYRIAYESILLAVHHEKATHINISLFSKNGRYHLVVEQLGIFAFQPNNNDMAVELMRYRAQQMHGRLQIATSSGKKKIITCEIPSAHLEERIQHGGSVHA